MNVIIKLQQFQQKVTLFLLYVIRKEKKIKVINYIVSSYTLLTS